MSAARCRFGRFRSIVLLLGLVVAGACSSTTQSGSLRDALIEQIRDRGLDPVTTLEPLRLSDDMKRFAQESVIGAAERKDRIQALVARLIDPEQLSLSYAWGYTGTAIEVFEQREANCLAFTNLFVGMAREVGVPVQYLLVRNSESFRKEGDLVVISDHVAVGFGNGPERLVIDLSREASASGKRIQPISDITALSLYYSNRGAETLQSGDEAEALDWLDTAIALDPWQASTWVNYGVALRRNGRPDKAEEAYRYAIELDPGSRSAATNLASLLRLESRDDEARELERVLAEKPGRNPYTYMALGDISLRGGRLDEAERLYRRAIVLDRDQAGGWAALGFVASMVGDEAAARRLLRKAEKRDAEHPRTQRLAAIIRDDGG